MDAILKISKTFEQQDTVLNLYFDPNKHIHTHHAVIIGVVRDLEGEIWSFFFSSLAAILATILKLARFLSNRILSDT